MVAPPNHPASVFFFFAEVPGWNDDQEWGRDLDNTTWRVTDAAQLSITPAYVSSGRGNRYVTVPRKGALPWMISPPGDTNFGGRHAAGGLDPPSAKGGTPKRTSFNLRCTHALTKVARLVGLVPP